MSYSISTNRYHDDQFHIAVDKRSIKEFLALWTREWIDFDSLPGLIPLEFFVPRQYINPDTRANQMFNMRCNGRAYVLPIHASGKQRISHSEYMSRIDVMDRTYHHLSRLNMERSCTDMPHPMRTGLIDRNNPELKMYDRNETMVEGRITTYGSLSESLHVDPYYANLQKKNSPPLPPTDKTKETKKVRTVTLHPEEEVKINPSLINRKQLKVNTNVN